MEAERGHGQLDLAVDPRLRVDLLAALLEEDGDREEYLTLRSRYFQLKDASHQVILVQPFIKNKTSPDGSNAVNNCELALAESKALVETLNWKVVDAVTAGLASYQKRELFGSGKLAELENLVSRDLRITAVFVSLYQLTTTQRIGLEDRFKVPVIDRYNIVLQIFHQHARTAEARLQVALAEIPYLKNRLMVDYERDQIAKHTKGNLGESVFDRKRFVLKKLALFLLTHTKVNASPIKKLFDCIKFCSRNLFSFGCATIYSKSEVILKWI